MSNQKSKQTPEDDSPVGDVRRVRQELSDRFGNDVRKLAEHARLAAAEAAQELGCPLVRKQPVPASANSESAST